MLSVIAIVNVVLGFAREGVIAYFYGTSAELDAFLVAYTLPRLVALQAVQVTVSIILPLYVAHLHAGRREDATALLRRWFMFLFKATTVFCLLIALAAPLVTRAIGPGLSASQSADAAAWLRWLLPYVWVITLSGCFRVVLDQNRRFFLPAMTSAFVSIAVIGACFLGAQSFGVSAMLPGYLVGGILGFVWQWKQSHPYEPKLMSFRDMPLHVQLPLASGGIMVLNSLARQASQIVDRIFASSLPEGSIAALNYAGSVMAVLQTVIGAALGTALFPVLSEMIAKGAWRQAYRTTLAWAGVVTGILLIPVLGVVFWRVEIVRILFQRGAFGQAATDMTAYILIVLSFILLVDGCNVLVMRLLLAQQQLRLILISTIAMVVLKVGINALLVRRYQLLGVAIATVASAGFATAMRFWGGGRYQGPTEAKESAS
jgi:putative peptidoglycan lipid II flippase